MRTSDGYRIEILRQLSKKLGIEHWWKVEMVVFEVLKSRCHFRSVFGCSRVDHKITRLDRIDAMSDQYFYSLMGELLRLWCSCLVDTDYIWETEINHQLCKGRHTRATCSDEDERHV